MKSSKIKSVLIAAAFLVGCSANDTRVVPEPHKWAKAVQTADSKEAHLLLADHYEDIAKTLEADAVEEQEMLDEYVARPWEYGKRILDLKAHATAMIQDLKKAAQESRKMADYHRAMAGEKPR